jgi:hypothetical protein
VFRDEITGQDTRFVCGLDGGDGGGFLRGGFFLLALQHSLDELGYGAFAFGGLGDFGTWGEDAEGGVNGDLFYGFGLFDFLAAGLGGLSFG